MNGRSPTSKLTTIPITNLGQIFRDILLRPHTLLQKKCVFNVNLTLVFNVCKMYCQWCWCSVVHLCYKVFSRIFWHLLTCSTSKWRKYNSWVPVIAEKLKNLIVWLPREPIRACCPDSFRDKWFTIEDFLFPRRVKIKYTCFYTR